MTAKTFERTYEIDTAGAPFAPVNSMEKAGLTRRLRSDAKKEGIDDLGDTTVVSRAGLIGGIMKVTVRASVGEKPTEQPEPVED